MNKPEITKPEIILLCGIPCSGKSSFVQKYKSVVHRFAFAIISRDTIREMQSRPYVYTRENEDEVTRSFDWQYRKYARFGWTMILDNTHCKESYLDAEIRRKPEGYTLRIMFFDIPLWQAHIRNVCRFIKTGKWIPIKIMNQMKKNYDKIDKKKYDMVF